MVHWFTGALPETYVQTSKVVNAKTEEVRGPYVIRAWWGLLGFRV
jgi:hypothetical protein